MITEAQLTRTRDLGRRKENEAKGKSYGEYEIGYWSGYSHCAADLLQVCRPEMHQRIEIGNLARNEDRESWLTSSRSDPGRDQSRDQAIHLSATILLIAQIAKLSSPIGQDEKQRLRLAAIDAAKLLMDDIEGR